MKNNKKYANQTGTASWNPYWNSLSSLDYSTNPAGVNPNMTQFLAVNGVLTPNGDPLNTSLSTKQYANGDVGNFWKIVFPQGENDCDLQAAINNITAKIAQFGGMINGNANKWVQANISKGGGCAGCQGDAAAYIMSSYGTLKTILAQYQAIYASHSSNGGGCADGLTASSYQAQQKAQQNATQQLCIQQKAIVAAANNAPLQAEAAANSSNILSSQIANEASTQGSAAGVAAASTTMSPTTMMLYVLGAIALVGGIVYFIHKETTKK